MSDENEFMNGMDDGQAAEGEQSAEGMEGEIEGLALPRRNAFLNANTYLLLGLLGAVGLGTYLMCLRAGGQVVAADPQVAAASKTINEFLKGGMQEQYQLAKTQRDTEKTVAQFSNYPSARQVPLEGLRDNPFRDVADTQPVSLSQDTKEVQEEERIRESQQIAQGLKLETIVFGSHSVCMINGRMYSVGQGTEAFTVQKIEPTKVTVTVGTLELVLQMPPPQLN